MQLVVIMHNLPSQPQPDHLQVLGHLQLQLA